MDLLCSSADKDSRMFDTAATDHGLATDIANLELFLTGVFIVLELPTRIPVNDTNGLKVNSPPHEKQEAKRRDVPCALTSLSSVHLSMYV